MGTIAAYPNRQRNRIQNPDSVSSNLTAATIGHYPNGRGSRFRTGPVGVRISGALPYLAVYPNWQRGRVESAFSAGSNPATVTKTGEWRRVAKAPLLQRGFRGFDPLRLPCDRRLMAGPQPSKLMMRVRYPPIAPMMRVSGGRYSGSYPELSGFNSQARNHIVPVSLNGRADGC